MQMQTTLEFVAPRTIRRVRGGWLAVSAVGAPLQIGVAADPEERAREAYAQAFLKWEAILRSERKASSFEQ